MKLEAAALMLLSLGALGVLGEVVQDFRTCNEFFLGGQAPVFQSSSTLSQVPSRTGPYYKICQKYNNQYHYATLYDSFLKIPVYSAYQYQKSSDCTVARPDITWMIEPQIEGRQNNQMELQGSGSRNPSGRQAYNSDYENSRYDKGHLYPHCQAPSQIASDSTFTLTNAAPQRCDFNKFWYSKVENVVRNSLKACVSRKLRAYVVTGVLPNSIGQTLKRSSTVNVPTHFWTAHCCCDNNDRNCAFGGFVMQSEADDPTPFTDENTFNNNLGNGIKVFNNACRV